MKLHQGKLCLCNTYTRSMSLYCSYVKCGWNVSKLRGISQCELGHFQLKAYPILSLKDTLPDFNILLTDPKMKGAKEFQVHCT